MAREIPVTLLALGVDPAPLIAAAGLDPALLEDTENLLPASWLGRLLDACGMATDCPCLALLVGTRAGLSSLGMVGLLMQHSPSVADALGCLVRHGHLYHPEIVPTLQIRDGAAVLRYRVLPADMAGSEEAAECALAAADPPLTSRTRGD
ncbi:AraC family transcriptional regulator ligand-binding domain-containing protein [Methylobacterium sp. P31]